MQRILRSNNLVRDICSAPANYNSRQTVLRPMVKTYTTLYGRTEEGFLEEILEEVTTELRLWRMDDFWHCGQGDLMEFMKRERGNYRDWKVGNVERPCMTQYMQSLGCGWGSETVRMDWGWNGKDLAFNSKEIHIRTWKINRNGFLKKLMNEHYSILLEVKAP